MSNYFIDASVYALPECIPEDPDEEIIKSYEKYIDNLNILINLLFPYGETSINKFLKVNQFLFSSSDLKFLSTKNLILDRPNKGKLEKILKNSNQRYYLHNLWSNFSSIINYLYTKEINYSVEQNNTLIQSPRPKRWRILEDYLDVNNIEVKENNICDTNIKNIIKSVPLFNNFKKNLYMLTFLNYCIYKSSDITTIITASNENEFKLDINVINVIHKFNNIQSKIWISKGLVKNKHIKNIKFGNFLSLRQVFNNIESNGLFANTLVFNKKIYDYMDEYEGILNRLFEASDEYVKNDIGYFKTEYLNIVFDCLHGLDKLAKFIETGSIIQPSQAISQNFSECEDWIKENEICKKCCCYLRLCGYNCSGEKIKREIDNDLYVIHLKPYSWNEESKEKHLVELTLRIYFRWDDDKIKVGYIGKHLPTKNL